MSWTERGSPRSFLRRLRLAVETGRNPRHFLVPTGECSKHSPLTSRCCCCRALLPAPRRRALQCSHLLINSPISDLYLLFCMLVLEGPAFCSSILSGDKGIDPPHRRHELRPRRRRGAEDVRALQRVDLSQVAISIALTTFSPACVVCASTGSATRNSTRRTLTRLSSATRRCVPRTSYTKWQGKCCCNTAILNAMLCTCWYM